MNFLDLTNNPAFSLDTPLPDISKDGLLQAPKLFSSLPFSPGEEKTVERVVLALSRQAKLGFTTALFHETFSPAFISALREKGLIVEERFGFRLRRTGVELYDKEADPWDFEEWDATYICWGNQEEIPNGFSSLEEALAEAEKACAARNAEWKLRRAAGAEKYNAVLDRLSVAQANLKEQIEKTSAFDTPPKKGGCFWFLILFSSVLGFLSFLFYLTRPAA